MPRLRLAQPLWLDQAPRALILIATGSATSSLDPLAANFRLMNTYDVATRRMTARERSGDVMLWDTQQSRATSRGGLFATTPAWPSRPSGFSPRGFCSTGIGAGARQTIGCLTSIARTAAK
jgi:hypothetical protein